VTSRLAAFLAPGSIALVGVPSDLTRAGARPLLYLQKHGYPGQIYPVNPRHAAIGGLRAYPTLTDLPERPDTVWIGVPGADVLPVLEEAARLKVPNAVIMTSGFGETDQLGVVREGQLRDIADAAGMTVLGPNMLGFVNCWERVPLTFSSAGAVERLVPGALGIASQSGALGGVVANRAFDRLVGVSAMVSTGNEIGVTVSECLEYFVEDERTRAVALVVEGIRDGARFRAAAARLLEAGKPLVALKLGRSSTGRRNALTHTGALAGSHEAWRALARQLGIVEVETFEDLVEIGGFLSREGRVAGRGVGVVTTSGGASIMLADQLEAHGVPMPRLTPSTVEALGRLLPDYARTRDNPVDVTAGLSEPLFGRVLETLVADPGLDGVVVALTSGGAERARNLARVALAADKPVVACVLGGSVIEGGRVVLDEQAVGCFRSPVSLARALAAGRAVAEARAHWRRDAAAPRRRAVRVTPPRGYADLAALARRAGVPLVDQALVATPLEAARAARRLGFPVAVKVVSPDVAHKTEVQALALGLDTAGAVRQAATRMLRSVRGARIEGLLVQRMVRGVEVLVGVTRDPTFGPLLVVGAGGVEAELLGDTACRPLPVSRREIARMLDEVRTLRRLRGFRGEPAADLPALVRAIAGVARLAEMLGNDLTSLDVNPIMVGPRGRGAYAVDFLLGEPQDVAGLGPRHPRRAFRKITGK
jgi:acyl-CoA synthetase (NDP forming)